MNRIFVLGIALAIAVVGQAAAASLRYFGGSQTAIVVSGAVDSDGTVLRGAGFVARRIGIGTYTVTFAKGVFPKGCPAAMTITDVTDVADPPVAQVYPTNCSRKLELSFRAGGFVDTPFMFVAADTP